MPKSLPFALIVALFLALPPTASAASTLTVCPTGSTLAGCQYFGGDGIQQAVDAAPVGTPTDKTTILIKSGTYFTHSSVINIAGVPNPYHAGVATQKKFLVLSGETNTILKPATTDAMSGIAIYGGETEINSLEIRDFSANGIWVDYQGKAIITNSKIANNGRAGIAIYDNASTTTVENNTISTNAFYGIFVDNAELVTIQDNLINNNQLSGILTNYSPHITITNNTIFGNQTTGINAYSCFYNNINSDPAIIIKNNILANTTKNTDNTFGFGIGGSCWTGASLANDQISNNLIWNNQGDNTACNGTTNQAYEICTFPGKLVSDPQFVNPAAGDFHLQPDSPACTSGENGTYMGAFPCTPPNPPTVSSMSCPATAVVNQPQNISVTANDETAVKQIDFYTAKAPATSFTAAGTAACTGASCTRSFTWTPTSTGSYYLTVSVADNDAALACTDSGDHLGWCSGNQFISTWPVFSAATCRTYYYCGNPSRCTVLVTNAPPTSSTLALKIKFQGVTVQSPNQNVRVTLRQAGTIDQVFTVPITSDATGIYSYTGSAVSVAPGIYDILIKGPVHLQKRFTNIDLSAGGSISQDFTSLPLKAGDINGDNTVNIFDFNPLSSDFEIGVPKTSIADLNEDGKVDIFDFNLLSSNFSFGIYGDQ